MGTRKFKTEESWHSNIFALGESHLLEGFMNDLVSLPKLLERKDV
jgi:hypothetical protein